MFPRRLLPLVFAAVLPLGVPSLMATDTRGEFLKLIDRPRVPTDAKFENSSSPSPSGFTRLDFTFAADSTNRVPGILLKQTSSALASVRRPVVIALHGTGGNKETQLALLEQLAADGFIAVAIDARYHGARASQPKGTADYNAAILRAFQTGQEHPFFIDSAWDISRLVDGLVARDDVDPARIALIGFSKGGIEAYLTAAADPRIAATVAFIGVQSFGWALDHNAWQSRIGTIQPAFDAAAKASGVTKPDAAFVRRFYDRVAPGIYDRFDGPAMLPLIAPRPFLAINGDSDDRTPLPGLELCAAAARAAYKAAGAEENFTLTIQPNTGHKANPESVVAARAWLVRHLKP
jgi:dienelactone hydrolase